MSNLEKKEQSCINQELIPLSRWNDYFDYPTQGCLRQLVFYENSNGFSKVIRRIGHRIYIKTSAFFEWVEENNKERIV